MAGDVTAPRVDQRSAQVSEVPLLAVVTRSGQRTGLQIYLSLVSIRDEGSEGKKEKESFTLHSLSAFCLGTLFPISRGVPHRVQGLLPGRDWRRSICRPFSFPSLFLLHPSKICSPFC